MEFEEYGKVRWAFAISEDMRECAILIKTRIGTKYMYAYTNSRNSAITLFKKGDVFHGKGTIISVENKGTKPSLVIKSNTHDEDTTKTYWRFELNPQRIHVGKICTKESFKTLDNPCIVDKVFIKKDKEETIENYTFDEEEGVTITREYNPEIEILGLLPDW